MEKIFIFTWNTESVRYSNGDNDSCPKADFIQELYNKIIDADCDLVIIALQEDSIRDSPLIIDDESLIAKCLADRYTLIDIETMSGWGATTLKALSEEWKYIPRGLRMAIFKKKSFQLVGVITKSAISCPGIYDWITAGKGAIAISIETALGKITFINMHLPFSSRSLVRDSTCRHPALMWQAKCMKMLHDSIISTCKPDVVFLFGDLNFRVQLRTEANARDIAEKLVVNGSSNSNSGYITELIKDADELKLLTSYAQYSPEILPILSEGIDNKGPVFIPTCKLCKGRAEMSVESFKLGRKLQRTPSWCDRILYKAFSQTINIACEKYDRWEQGNMNLSDHAAVYGVFKLMRF